MGTWISIALPPLNTRISEDPFLPVLVSAGLLPAVIPGISWPGLLVQQSQDEEAGWQEGRKVGRKVGRSCPAAGLAAPAFPKVGDPPRLECGALCPGSLLPDRACAWGWAPPGFICALGVHSRLKDYFAQNSPDLKVSEPAPAPCLSRGRRALQDDSEPA